MEIYYVCCIKRLQHNLNLLFSTCPKNSTSIFLLFFIKGNEVKVFLVFTRISQEILQLKQILPLYMLPTFFMECHTTTKEAHQVTCGNRLGVFRSVKSNKIQLKNISITKAQLDELSILYTNFTNQPIS